MSKDKKTEKLVNVTLSQKQAKLVYKLVDTEGSNANASLKSGLLRPNEKEPYIERVYDADAIKLKLSKVIE